MIKREVFVSIDTDYHSPTVFRPGGTEAKIIITTYSGIENTWVRDRVYKRVFNSKEFESEMRDVIRKAVLTGGTKYKSLIGEDFE